MASSVSKTFSSSAMRPRRRMLQNFMLIWVDESIDETNEDCQNTLTHLRTLVKEINMCKTPAQCIDALNHVDDEKAFVISSGALGQNLVPSIHDMACVDAIYIFCGNKARHEGWAKEWSKIRGVFTSIQPICESLKKVTRDCDHNLTLMSFVPKQKAETSTSGEENFNQLPPTFMYSVLFKEIVLEIDDDDKKSMNDFTTYCRQKEITEEELKYFQHKYQGNSAVYIYTCDMFFYSMLNRALSTLDTKTMTKMGFFIRKLHRQLEQLHEEQKHQFKKKFFVYRGQGFAPEQFQQLFNIRGGLLSFNNFLSTSKTPEVALDFVRTALASSKDNAVVLFIMTIDPGRVSSTNTPYANIDEYSAIQSEQEILFSMHTVFNVVDMKQTADNKRVWEVQLSLTDDNDPQLATLTQRMREEIRGSTGWRRMAQLMIRLGDFSQAEELYNELFESSTSDSDRAHIYHQLGCLKDKQGEYQEAVKYYEKSLQIKRKTLPEDHASLATTYNQIGVAYSNMGDNWKALEYYDESLKIREKTLPPNHPSLATSYSNIGLVYNNMGDNSKSLEYYDKSLKIREKTLPLNHPLLATSYNNIGLVYNNIGDYSKALGYYDKSLEIYEKTLPPNHPDLATSYNNIGLVYNNMGDYSKALEYYDKSLKIYEKTLPPNHPSLATSHWCTSRVYDHMKQYPKAVSLLQKAITIYEKSLPPGHEYIKRVKDDITNVKKKM